ncbi:MAG: trypsin-like peptidase domain-containing protein [Fimbriimonadaceae bacterium]|nr:trypsin-like peptidase domain-containing protein [Fimbriimonadaceae bacterium]QYK58409.1 MAG: trypsin-like peptidase domain-containing protein [Fimbriimonadaceae bacterium]
MSNWTRILERPGAIIGAGALIVAGVVIAQTIKPGSPLVALPKPPVAVRTVAIEPPANLSMLKELDATFANLAEAASKAVVHITTNLGRLDGTANDQNEAFAGGGEGSGFIIREDGWIVTNDHVVGGKDKVRVVLADGREFLGRVTSTNDPQIDLAIIKIETKGLPTLAIADSNQVRVGQMAMAIGAPFSLEGTVTIGHISAIGRSGMAGGGFRQSPRVYSGMIQTDAAINPGNSGGPLINMDGQVVGVNTSIQTTSGGNNGIGFAIPGNVVRAVSDKLIKDGKFSRGLLGITPRDLKPFERSEQGVASGALVEEVPETSAAYKAGIRKGDVITKIGGEPITNEMDLRVSMYRHAPNDTVRVEYMRKKAPGGVDVKLTSPETLAQNAPPQPMVPDLRGGQDWFSQPDGSPFSQPSPNAPSPRTNEPPRLGVGIQLIDATMRQQFNIPSDVEGVVVTSVTANSFASRIGVQPGDVVSEVNGTQVRAVADVSVAMSKMRRGDTISLKLVRFSDGARKDLSFTMPLN